MDSTTTYKKNFRFHLLEGGLYLSTHSILYAPVFFPALILKLGGNNVVVGAFPVMVYLAFLLPQVLSPHFVRTKAYRKPTVIFFGFIQRGFILLLAIAIAVFGQDYPRGALVLLIVIFTLNQVISGIASPAWFDLVAKTTKDKDRGKLMGLRTSFGALLGLVNGSLLTFFLATWAFPFNYSAVIVVVFCFQFISLFLQKRLVESEESQVELGSPLTDMFHRIMSILKNNRTFRRFLFSSALLTIGLTPVGFFLSAAMSRFSVSESYVGWFTLTIVITQIVSGVSLGMLADRYGHRFVLLICGAVVGLASLVAFLSSSLVYFFPVFILVGINLSLEMMTRYNFAVDCAPVNERPMYVGFMNAWLAPWYAFSLLGGWAVEQVGYDAVFLSGVVFTGAGLLVLQATSDPRPSKLALSSK
ncbi:MAG: MFS transporter [Ignavibacteriales bacterium]|nr:MFS transporter [Ignavibacteriales bacterium]